MERGNVNRTPLWSGEEEMMGRDRLASFIVTMLTWLAAGALIGAQWPDMDGLLRESAAICIGVVVAAFYDKRRPEERE